MKKGSSSSMSIQLAIRSFRLYRYDIQSRLDSVFKYNVQVLTYVMYVAKPSPGKCILRYYDWFLQNVENVE